MLPYLFAFVAATALVNGAVFERGGFTPSSPPITPNLMPTPPCMMPPSIGCSSTPPPPPSSTPCSSTPPPPSSTPCPPSSAPPSIPPVSVPASTPCITPTPTPTPPSGTTNCNGIQQWQASFAYTAGNQVIFNNQLYTALQWTYNNAPPAHPDQWAAGGPCAQPINNKVDCTGVAAWQQSVAYTSGDKVTFNGHLWSAVQWTQSNAPGDTSGTWMDLGACK